MSEAVSNYSFNSGSGEYLLGVGGLVQYYNSYIRNFKEHMADVMSKVTPVYENQLRDHAVKKGWGDSSSKIAVQYDSDKMELAITGDPVKEYGTGVEPPRPVLRSAIANIQDLEDNINAQIERQLF